MQSTTISLDIIHSGWRGFLVTSSFDTLMRGLEREKARLLGLPFITFCFKQAYDYDGLTESLELLEGFSEQANAIAYLDQLTEESLAEALLEPGLGNSKWQDNVLRDNLFVKPCLPESVVQGIYHRSFELSLDTGYDKKNFMFEVLHISIVDAIGTDLFNYRDAESEWVNYFMSKGR